MKNILKLSLAVLAPLFLFACEVDQVGTKHTVTESGVSFPSNKYFIQHSMQNTTATVPVLRDNADEALTVSLTATGVDTLGGAVTAVPTSVSFAAGEYEATVTLSVDPTVMTPGLEYLFSLDLGGTIAAGNVKKVDVNLSLVLNWQDVGMGTFTYDGYYVGDDYLMLQHAESTNKFRIVDLFAAGVPIEFTVADDNSITAPRQETGIDDANYGMVFIETVPESPSFRDGNTFTFNFKYTVGAGSFGVLGPETFVLD